MARPYKGPRRFTAARLPVDLFARFEALARRRGVTLSDLLTEATAELVDRSEREAAAA